MNARSILTLACAAAVFPATAFAQKPPAKVEIIIEDDQEEDFFDDEDPKSKKVRERADGLQEEIETQEGVKIRTTRKKSRKGGENDNSATQVVNVIVQGSNQKQKAEPQATQAPAAAAVQQQSQATPAPVAPAPAPTAPAPVPSAPAPAVPPPTANATSQPPPAPDDCNCTVKEIRRKRRRKRRAYWKVPSHVRRGNVLLSMQGGWSSAGGLIGGKIEGMASNSTGIQLRFQATGFDRDEHFREGFDNFLGNEEWGVPQVDPSQVERGFAHITDLNFAWHLFNRSRFDLHPTFGVAHFGYHVDLRRQASLQGGSVLLRFGLGLNWHWRRLFAGVDLGWYPYEVLRYEVVEQRDGDRDARDVEIDDRWDSRRLITSGHIGFRF